MGEMKSPLHNAPVNVKPQGRGNYPREIDSASFSLGGDFDIRALPWGREFDIVTTCFGQKAVPRGARGNLTFSRCPGVGNLTLALVKMSNSPGSDRPPSTLELNIDRCINYFGHQTVNIWLFDEANMTFGCFVVVFLILVFRKIPLSFGSNYLLGKLFLFFHDYFSQKRFRRAVVYANVLLTHDGNDSNTS